MSMDTMKDSSNSHILSDTCTPERILIVGASSGLGKALAEYYITQGCRVAVAARRIGELEQLHALAPERVCYSRIDITEPDGLKALEALIAELGGVDIYIHSSGIGSQNESLSLDIEEDTCRVNVLAFTRFVDYMFAYFADRGHGHIVALSSVAGTRGLGIAAAYSASKAYQATYLQSLRQLCAIRSLSSVYITDIRPGFVATALLGNASYPMLMSVGEVVPDIVRSIALRKRVRIIDIRYRLLVGLWRLVPRVLWERLPVGRRRR